MADVPVRDDDALRHAGRAGGVDEIGRVIRRQAPRPRIDRAEVGGIGQALGGEDRAADGSALGEGRRGEKAAGLGVGEAGGDAVDRRVRIEGQPGGAGLGDADLGDEEVGAAAHPEPDDVARPDAAPDEPAGDGVRRLVDLAVGEAALAEDQGDAIGMFARARGEDFGQNFVAQEIGPHLARKAHRPGLRRPKGRALQGIHAPLR